MNKILCYDRAAALFYIDPPYFRCEDDYGKGMFARSDFEVLADILAALKGRFLLSLNDTPEVREIFAAFHIEAVESCFNALRHWRPVQPIRRILCGPFSARKQTFLAGGLDETAMEAIRSHGRTGHPLGSAEFFDKLEAILGRNVRPRKPGRPRKAGDTL